MKLQFWAVILVSSHLQAVPQVTMLVNCLISITYSNSGVIRQDKSAAEAKLPAPPDEVKDTPSDKAPLPIRSNVTLTSFFTPKPKAKKKSKKPIDDKEEEQQQPLKKHSKKTPKIAILDLCGCGKDWVGCQFALVTGKATSSTCTPQPINNV